MNFLAHIYLSFGNRDLTLGNFIADHIKGRDYRRYPKPVQDGILLHRAIDAYTDAHPIARSSSKRLHSRHSHYSRVIVDVYYDHFLARNWETYSPVPLEDYTSRFYDMAYASFDMLPPGIQGFLPFMVRDNWLLHYAELSGIEKVLKGLDRRAGPRSRMDEAVTDLEKHYREFESEFQHFFEELIIFSRQQIQSLRT